MQSRRNGFILLQKLQNGRIEVITMAEPEKQQMGVAVTVLVRPLDKWQKWQAMPDRKQQNR